MAIGVYFQPKGLTTQQYDGAVKKLEAAGAWPPKGMIHHTAFGPADGLMVFEVWGSAEEINLDFAGPIRATNQPKVARLRIDQRVTLNPWAAKRLAIALNQAVARYEQTYGALELDERKRRTAVGPSQSSKPS